MAYYRVVGNSESWLFQVPYWSQKSIKAHILKAGRFQISNARLKLDNEFFSCHVELTTIFFNVWRSQVVVFRAHMHPRKPAAHDLINIEILLMTIGRALFTSPLYFKRTFY